MKKYDNSATRHNSRRVTRGRTRASGSFYYGIWSVKYQYLEPGLVAYDYKISKLTKAVVTSAAVSGVLASTFYLFGPAAGVVFI